LVLRELQRGWRLSRAMTLRNRAPRSQEAV